MWVYLSGVVVCQDEIKTIGACLRSLEFCDEIVVVDSGSTDGTRALIAQTRARVFERSFKSYGDQKEFARQMAQGDWVLHIDADEVVSPELSQEILAVIHNPAQSFAAYRMPFRNHFRSVWVRGAGYYPDYHVRLMRRAQARWDIDAPVHERVIVRGEIGVLGQPVDHYSFESAADFICKSSRYAQYFAEQAYRSGKIVGFMTIAWHTVGRFLKAFFWQGGFRDGTLGLTISGLQAYEVFQKYVRVWDLNQQRTGNTVIIDPAFVGDVVFSAPLVQALKRRQPEGLVGMVVRPGCADVARAIPGVDRVHVFDKRGQDRGWKGIQRVAATLAAEHYDRALIPHPSWRSALLAKRSGIGIRVASHAGWVARCLGTQVRPPEPNDTLVRARLRLLGEDEDKEELGGTLRGPEPQTKTDRRLRVGLILGSEWATKRWPPDRAAVFLRSLDPNQIVLVTLGSESERNLFHGLMPPSLTWVDGMGGSMAHLLENVASCDVVIGGDTGPLHLARGLGIPVIALFGPTSEARHRFTPEDQVLGVPMACRPCSPHGQAVCPRGHHACMRTLEPARVTTALMRALQRIESGRAS